MSRFTATDEVVGYAAHNGVTNPPVTVRRRFHDGVFLRAEVYVGGWRTGGPFTTEAGAVRRANREVNR